MTPSKTVDPYGFDKRTQAERDYDAEADRRLQEYRQRHNVSGPLRAAPEHELELAATALRQARENGSAATTAGRNAARNASKAGMSEVAIAKALGVNRRTVRNWLGKPR